ncbi:hypothetical protein F1D05_37850 [Kribbella qitaiheensis]|uniref:Uncharacterized protein n=1 Tax=Kribbella qitaiheensis TaxID=1544730 RepID=A0A7G6X8Q0_9ACTN|nr:hypothetical protein [Kribbella qitaiheensis]QNE22615.1 hypothetical protein F1D05_37850 [Kribbella qitaiheensis]
MTDAIHPRPTPIDEPQSGHPSASNLPAGTPSSATPDAGAPHPNAIQPGAHPDASQVEADTPYASNSQPGVGSPYAGDSRAGRRVVGVRLVRGAGYGVGLVGVGVVAVVQSVGGRLGSVQVRWRRMAGYLGSAEPVRLRRPGRVNCFVHGVLSVVFGLLSLFLLMLLVLSVVRGPFYGFVEDGPFGPGTWGGPTKAGAWMVHAAIALPIIVMIPFVLRGLALLHAAEIRRMYGSAVGWWVLPATILLSVGGILFFYSWTQQI